MTERRKAGVRNGTCFFYKEMINKNNQKSKLQGVFKTVDVLGRNSSSKVYYRVALREETDKFLNYLISEVEKGYRPLVKDSVNNSVNLKELFSKAKIV